MVESIELGRDASYLRFTAQFPRTYYISATLRVGHDEKASFGFTRARLALPAEVVGDIALESPFDAKAQARLVVFDDFPSWAEQTVAATRTVAHQLARYGEEMIRPDPGGEIEGAVNGALVLTTSRSAAADIGAHLVRLRATSGHPLALAEILGARRAIEQFSAEGGILLGTKGLWQGVDVADARRLRLVWINKLPFLSFEDPLIKTRRALIAQSAREAGSDDPDGRANEHYYLPLAAIELRQAVGRLLRTTDHRGVVVISDRKLSGPTRLRRMYRDIFLGSLDAGLLVANTETREAAGGNITSMAEGWRRIWSFFADQGLLDAARAAELSTDAALEEHTLLPETLRIRRLRLPPSKRRNCGPRAATSSPTSWCGARLRSAACSDSATARSN